MIVVEVPALLIVLVVLSFVLVYGAVFCALFVIAIPQLIMGGVASAAGLSEDFEDPAWISATISGIFFFYYIISGMIYGMFSADYPRLQNWIQYNLMGWADSLTARQFMPPIARHLAYIIVGMLLITLIAFAVSLVFGLYKKLFGPNKPPPDDERRAY